MFSEFADDHDDKRDNDQYSKTAQKVDHAEYIPDNHEGGN
jgi:hypothetical protein